MYYINQDSEYLTCRFRFFFLTNRTTKFEAKFIFVSIQKMKQKTKLNGFLIFKITEH